MVLDKENTHEVVIDKIVFIDKLLILRPDKKEFTPLGHLLDRPRDPKAEMRLRIFSFLLFSLLFLFSDSTP
jgi:hypothetical protein